MAKKTAKETAKEFLQVMDATPKVRVFKRCNDSTVSFCGEPVQTSETGREFFELHDYMKPVVDMHSNLIWPEEATTGDTPESE